MKGLIIRSPWIDLILEGSKTWEMRTRPISIRGRIALIKAGSGLIYGTADLVDCLPSMTVDRMRATRHFHAIPETEIEDAAKNRWTTPWVLQDVVRLASPKPYVHRKGAVTWVDLPETPGDASSASGSVSNLDDSSRRRRPSEQTLPPSSSLSRHDAIEWVDIHLTEGNIRNSHFYLRTAERLLPADCIGGANKNGMAKSIRVRFDPGREVECDVAGDKMILRSRSPVREFFERTGAKASDFVRFGRTAEREFVVTFRRPTDC